MTECKTCIHKDVCAKTKNIENYRFDGCEDYGDEDGVILPKYPLYGTVYFIDRFNIDAQCSDFVYVDGTKLGGKRERIVRECSVQAIAKVSNTASLIYSIMPKVMTPKEEIEDRYYYWCQGFYEENLFSSREEAEQALREGR